MYALFHCTVVNTNERVEGESGNEARIYCNLLSVVTYALVQWAEYSVKVYCDLVIQFIVITHM